MFKKILVVLILGVGGFLAYAYTRPDTYKVVRSTKIEAPAPVVFSQLENFRAWAAWSPWDKLDPTMKKTYDGPPAGAGAAYAWQGNKKTVGKGKMTILHSQPPNQLKIKLEFIEPFASVANTTFDLKAEGEKTADVTWTMEGTNNLMGKVYGVFVDMDKAIGADFDKGLKGLKAVAESEAQKLAEAALAAAKAKAEAEAKAAADAAAAAALAEAETAKGKGKKKK